ncbi:probable ATP-dependent DNA helicase CHR12 [Ipomoea triloba]|uniref:probable ATP-dependent DNA helicase CHR12 n=1 Tax=Ipomoea triloba TaxID=35885 RepID=UPI00125D36BE|nr:probable ATP-dependent DNA helicase CHR12 [Ipomoea triloba]
MGAQVDSQAAAGGVGGGSASASLASPVAADQDHIESTKTLICALNFLSRNLPLPQDVFDAVSSIFRAGEDDATDDCAAGEADNGLHKTSSHIGSGMATYGDLMADFEDSLLKEKSSRASGSLLKRSKEIRNQSLIHSRLTELEELPTSRGEDLQSKCLLELYGLKLLELQRKVRSEVSSEYWLRAHCINPDKQLFDWGMMRLRRPVYGIGDAFAVESDDPLKKKRDAERLSRLEEEARNRVETKKRKFFADILNAARELQLQVQAAQKRRKQRNDGVQAWHGRQRQRATRAERLRFQALKADDQEAYMKLVDESKNERLRLLLQKTNDLLGRLGAAVQRQKDADHDGIEPLEGLDADLTASKTETPGQSVPEEDEDIVDGESTRDGKANDLLEGQRKYNSAVHSIQEKVTEQPTMLQGGELRPYQIEGLQWMLSLFNNNLNGILADEMGLGKTIQTISLIAYLMENKGVTGPHLIVAPKAVLPNWINEFQTWLPSAVTVLYDGRLDERKALREEYSGEGKFNVIITHYDLIMRDKAFLKKIHWNYLIIDEGHRLKNHECALARTVAGYRIRRRLLLTGTPIQNSLQELWSLLNFLLPNIFNSVENFEDWFNAPFSDKCDVTITDEEELLIIRRLHHVIRPFILRRKKDEVEKYLPGKTQVILKCDMSAWQKLYYHQVTEEGRVGLGTGTGKSKSLQNLSMQLRKCCNHPYLFVNQYNMWQKEEIVRASGKFELLDRLLPKLRKAGHRVLLFSQMTRLMDILEIYLQLNEFKYLRLDGSTKTEERGSLLKQFNAPDSPFFMFLLSTRAGGLGLNLQTADTVIIFDSDWNPQMDQQAEDRAHRIGQKKEVRVFVLVSVGSIEEVILDRAKQKMGIDAKVIQAGLFNTTSTAQDRREMLEEIMRKGTSTLGTDVPTEREINHLAARSKEEYWLFERMDEERRQKERYRSRLMEDYEVPDWAYVQADSNQGKGKGFLHDSANLTGKRKRKEVVYVDTLSDQQWMRAVENGEDFSKHSKKKRQEHQPAADNNPLPSNTREHQQQSARIDALPNKWSDQQPVPNDTSLSINTGGEKKAQDTKSETVSLVNEATSEDTIGTTSKRFKPVAAAPAPTPSQRDEYNSLTGNFDGLTWKALKRKRSSLA